MTKNKNNEKVFIIDASAIFFKKVYGNSVTVSDVIDEVKDDDSRLYLAITKIKVEEPSKDSIKFIEQMAKSTGDIYKLSKSDIKLIALAYEKKKSGKKVAILTDDYSIQNLAKSLGLETESVIQKGITKTFRWIKVCRGCGRVLNAKTNVCPICGCEAIIRRVDKQSSKSL